MRLVRAMPGSDFAPSVVGRCRLESRLLGVTPVYRASAVVDFFEGMQIGDGLDLVHLVHEPGPAPKRYELSVEVVQHRALRSAEFMASTAQALSAALPGLAFGTVDEPEPLPSALPARAIVVPAPLVMMRPQRGGQWDVVDVPLALPAMLPGWPLTSPIEEPLAGQLAVRIRLRACALSEERRRAYFTLLNEVRQGRLKLRHPGAPDDQFAHDPELVESAVWLLKQWLVRPRGLVADIVLSSDQELSNFAIQRIARDVFGRDVACRAQPTDAASDSVGGECPVPLSLSQGLPGLFPPSRLLAASGVPAVQVLRGPLPTGPGAVIGRVGDHQPVVIPDSARTAHMAVIGASGSGKSSFLLQLLQCDMQAGHGVGLIDPHGDLFERVLRIVPQHRVHDVVVVDVEDPAFSVAINPMEGVLGRVPLQHYIASQIGDIIESLFENSVSTGPLTRNHVRHALLLAMQHPEGGTLRDAARVFEDQDFRAWLLTKATPEVKGYFQTFQKTDGEHGFKNWLPYMLARLQPFATNPAMLRLLSRPSTVSLERLMDEGRIVLFKLSKSALQEIECRLLGTVLLKAFHAAALARSRTRAEDRRAFHLVVDEFHTFATDAAPALFSEARKYGLGLTVATQTWSSLRGGGERGELPNAVLANTATKVLFRLSAKDAMLLEEYSMPQFSAASLVRTPNYQAVVCQSGGGLEPCLVRVSQPDESVVPSDPKMLRTRSGEKHGSPLAAANEFLARRHGLSMDTLAGDGVWTATT